LNTNGVENEYICPVDAVLPSELSGQRERSSGNLSLQVCATTSQNILFRSFYKWFIVKACEIVVFLASPDSAYNINFDDDIELL